MQYLDFYNKVINNDIDYLIGIDFGHGETTASYYDINGLQSPDGADKLHKLMLSNDGNRKKVYSAFYTMKDGSSYLVTNRQDFSKPGIRAGFKAPVADIEQDWRCDAMRQFIQVVYKAIKDNNPFLYEGGRPKFLIFVACPSQWTELEGNAAVAYKKFIEDAGMPVELMLKESDAAFLKWRHVVAGKNVLVIDLGSSTIDFTAYKDSKRVASIGRPCGASKVEILLSEHCTPDADSLNNIKNWMSARGIDSRLIEESCLLFIREKKELFYTHYSKEGTGIDIDVREGDYTNEKSTKRLMDCVLSKEMIDRIVAKYQDELKLVLNEIKVELLNDYNFTPAHIILSGGASRMYFVENLVNEVFSCKVAEGTLQKDPEPEYVVSDGLAKYAAVRYDVATRTIDVINQFVRWAEQDDNLLKIYSKCLTDALLETQLAFEKDEIYSNYVDSEYYTSYEDFINVAVDTINSLNTTHRPEFVKKTSEKVNQEINTQLIPKVESILDELTGKKVHINEIVKIDTIPEDAEATSGYLYKFINDIAVDIHSEDILVKTPNYTKSRNRDERIRIVERLIDKEKSPEGKWNDNEALSDSRREIVNGIIESACMQIEKIIIEYELFDTIY